MHRERNIKNNFSLKQQKVDHSRVIPNIFKMERQNKTFCGKNSWWNVKKNTLGTRKCILHAQVKEEH
jgi:hypothetical protein